MITGTIEHGLHPYVFLKITGSKSSQAFEMLVNTGFDMDIGLHLNLVDQLG